MIAKWERLEPTAHRTPVPEAIYRAVISVSLCWGWRLFAAVVGITFLGITRPSEALFALRKNLVLPVDRLEPSSGTAYLRIMMKAKTSGRGNARVQHASVEDDAFVRFLETVFKGWGGERRINACSSSAFRRRWNVILESLEIPPNCGLTPGGLRGGGCVASLQGGCDIGRLLWKMRLRHRVTLEKLLTGSHSKHIGFFATLKRPDEGSMEPLLFTTSYFPKTLRHQLLPIELDRVGVLV